MAIAGTFETMSLADLLQLLSANTATGTLRISNPKVTKSIFFKNGRIISSASTDPAEFLGHFLVSHRFISEEELAAGMREQAETRQLLGAILVRRGAISQEDLDRMLVLKSEESIFDLFSWPDGDFEFIDGELPERELIPISVDVTGLLLEGMQRQDEWGRIREVVPSPLAVPVVVGDLEVVADELGGPQRTILALIDDDRSIEEICLESHASEFEVAKAVYEAAVRGAAKVVRPRVVDDGLDAAPASDAGELVRQARRLLDEASYELALRHVRASVSLEPHDYRLREQATEVEDGLRAGLEANGLLRSSVPVLAVPIAEAGGHGLTPEEGFILSRVNGSSDIGAILAISPLPELDALVVLWKLLRQGLIRLQPGGPSGRGDSA